MLLLVVAAWEPELERFRELSPLAAEVVVRAVGVGPVAAALGTQRSIREVRPDFAVLLGTCGAVPGGGLVVGDVLAASTARLVDPLALEGRSALPYAEDDGIRLDAGITAALVHAGARLGSVANTLGITTDDAVADRLRHVASAEHLEAYGFARACAESGAPAAIALGVANDVGERGREQWRANHVAASARAAEVAHAGLEAWLRLGFRSYAARGRDESPGGARSAADSRKSSE